MSDYFIKKTLLLKKYSNKKIHILFILIFLLIMINIILLNIYQNKIIMKA